MVVQEMVVTLKGQIRPITLILMLILFVVMIMLVNTLYFTEIERRVIFISIFIFFIIFLLLAFRYALKK